MRFRNPYSAIRTTRRACLERSRKVALSPCRRVSAFTLLEVMVAMSILTILFVLLFVPLRLGMNYLHQAQGDIRIQDTLRTIMARMVRELRPAVMVFPNDGGSTTLTAATLPSPNAPITFFVQNGTVFNTGDFIRVGVPLLSGGGANPDFYTPKQILAASRTTITVRTLSAAHLVGDVVTGPSRYFSGTDADQFPGSPCQGLPRATVLSRLDFQVPANLLGGGTPRIVWPLQAEPQIVTYYVRLRDPSPGQIYDERDNPLVLYRAQYIPPSAAVDACHVVPGSPFAPLTGWLRDNADLEPVALIQTPAVQGAPPVGLHTALTPTEDLNVLGRRVTDPANPAVGTQLISDTTFQTEDTGHNGRVDRVTINLVVGRWDSTRRETVRETLRQTVDLKNTK